ncbi:MAG: ABC transporter ATP-binding protein [Limisphaerales bacterium]
MQNLRNVWKFGWPHLRKYKGRLAIGVVLGVIFGATNLGFVWATKILTVRFEQKTDAKPVAAAPVQAEEGWQLSAKVEDLKHRLVNGTNEALDDWLPKTGRPMDAKQITGILLLLPLLMALRGFTGYASSYCLAWVSERIVHDLRMQVIDKFQSLSLDYFNRTKLGDLITRVTGDTAMIQRTLSLVFSDLVKEPATIVAILAGMVVLISWKLTLFVFVFLPICVLPLVILGAKVKKAMKGNVAANISQSSLLIEAANGIRVVKAYSMEKEQRKKFDRHSRKILHHNMKLTQASELVNPCIEIICMVGLALLTIFVFYSGAGMDDLAPMVVAIGIMFTPVKKLGRIHIFIQRASVGVDRLDSLFSEKPLVKEPEKPVDLKSFEDEIAVEGLGFRYEKDAVLEDLTLKIPRGHKLGIAGESGSGKSTMINLLLRFYDPSEGRITVDGKDLREIRSQELFEQVALVSQDVVVFDMSIAENIACGSPHASPEQIEYAAKEAFAHEFIKDLPDGYDTQVGERGVTLSGGQRQRLAIARAFVKNAPILLLDEATAALDSKAEAEVQRAIERLEENRTVVCIAHRLSTLSNMDRIIVLRHGKIVESGGFNELLEKNEEFAAMARRQGITVNGED